MASKTKEVEPTPEEKKNGWTKESLNAYLRERTREKEHHAAMTETKVPRLQVITTRSFNPHSW